MRCKMVLQSKGIQGGWNERNPLLATVVLHPVTGGSVENKAFWEATPAGKLELSVVNFSAVEGLEVGKEYYIDITPAN